MKKRFLKLALCLLLALSANPVFAQTNVGLGVKPGRLILTQNVIYGVDPNNNSAETGTSLLLLQKGSPNPVTKFRVDGDGNVSFTGSISGNISAAPESSMYTFGAVEKRYFKIYELNSADSDRWLKFKMVASNGSEYSIIAEVYIPTYYRWSGYNPSEARIKVYGGGLRTQGITFNKFHIASTVQGNFQLWLEADGLVNRNITLQNYPGGDIVSLISSQTTVPGSIVASYDISANGEVIAGGDTAFSTGNVGIGTTNPATKLEVHGTTAIGQYTNGTAVIDAYGGNAYFGNNSATNGIAINPFGNVGIGVIAPNAKLQVSDNVNIGSGVNGDQGLGIYYGSNSSSYGRIRFYSGGTNNNTIHSFSSSWGGSFFGGSMGALNLTGINGVTIGDWNNVDAAFAAGGNAYFKNNVGIGTNAPGYKLDVRGSMFSNNHVLNNGGGSFEIGTDSSAGGFYIYDSSLGAYRVVVKQTTGNVGIGTTAPIGKLHVYAGGAGGVGWGTGLNVGDSSNYTGLIQDGGVSRWRNTGAGGWDWYNSSASTRIMALDNSGNLSTAGDITAGLSANRYVNAGRLYLNNSAWHGWGNSIIDGRVWSANSNIHLSPPAGYNVVINTDYRDAGGGTGLAGLHLSGNGTYGGKMKFGDGDYVYLEEPTDDNLTIHASSIKLDTYKMILSQYDSSASFYETGSFWSTISPNDGTGAPGGDVYYTRVGAMVTLCFDLIYSKNSSYVVDVSLFGLPASLQPYGDVKISVSGYATPDLAYYGYPMGRHQEMLWLYPGNSNMTLTTYSNWSSGGYSTSKSYGIDMQCVAYSRYAYNNYHPI